MINLCKINISNHKHGLITIEQEEMNTEEKNRRNNNDILDLNNLEITIDQDPSNTNRIDSSTGSMLSMSRFLNSSRSF
jgi:hypothetical protein